VTIEVSEEMGMDDWLLREGKGSEEGEIRREERGWMRDRIEASEE